MLVYYTVSIGPVIVLAYVRCCVYVQCCAVQCAHVQYMNSCVCSLLIRYGFTSIAFHVVCINWSAVTISQMECVNAPKMAEETSVHQVRSLWTMRSVCVLV